MKKRAATILMVLLVLLISASVVFAQTVYYSYLPAVFRAYTNATVTATATCGNVYTQSGGTITKSGQAYNACNTDQSTVYVSNSGAFTLSNSNIVKSGNTSSNDNSSFYGLNAAVLATTASTINLSGSTIYSVGSGANAAFAYGTGTTVNLSDVTITAIGGGAHGVMATGGGVMTLTNVDINTTGANSAPIATDRGSGTITVTGGEYTASGADSPCLYSTGVIEVTGGTCTITGAESAVIEGANYITTTNTILTSSKSDKWSVLIYQSMSGDAEGKKGIFSMVGGTLANTATTGPLFYVTNTTGIITLKGVSVTAGSGTLIKAAAGNWGASGSNGGTVVFTVDGQVLSGGIVADNISSVTATLNNASSLTGAIDASNTASEVNLTLDGTSSWTVTANSYLTCLSDTDGISGTTISNITGNGYTVYYNASSCSALGGLTYTLIGGGTLQPGG